MKKHFIEQYLVELENEHDRVNASRWLFNGRDEIGFQTSRSKNYRHEENAPTTNIYNLTDSSHKFIASPPLYAL